MKQRRILVIRLSALGDVAMTVPVIYSLARRYPELSVTVLTRPFFARLFIDPPANVELMAADTKGRHHGSLGLMRLIGELRHRRFDMVADLHDLLRSRIISTVLRATGCRVATVDKDRRGRRLITDPDGGRRPQRSYLLRYADTFARLGYPVDIDTAPVVGKPELSATPAVGIAPFARYLTKTYPTELMEQVVGLLSARNYRVLLFGGKGPESDTLGRWADQYPNVTSIAGKLPLEDEIRTMASLDVMVSMDSANMHLASLAGIPVVSVWGGTTPGCGFLGWRQTAADTVCAGLKCQPCSVAGTPRCPLGTLECLRAIAPETIADHVDTVINRRRHE